MAASTEGHIVITATATSWVLISDAKGRTLYDRVMQPGEHYAVPEAAGLTLTTGNASALDIALDGTPLPRLSKEPSHVTRNFALDPATLKHWAAGSANGH